MHFLLALVVILALAWLASFDRRKIRYRFILQLIVIEAALAWFFLHAESGLSIIKTVSGLFESLLKFAAEGSGFVFGAMSEKGWRLSFSASCARLFLSLRLSVFCSTGRSCRYLFA